ncbi:MAG: MBL fold metallo-hydrolase [Candidatus Heimdallarchaeaceae archaeon]|jgi:glyoxylase-like metal-dependent hydrolase (beta-lactamase superfamily II)
MEVKKLGSRGILFNLPSKPYSVQIYCINTPNYLFIIDSGVVLESQMEDVKKYLEENNLLTKPVIIFNTHCHIDHIAGNGVIDSEAIISHSLSLEAFQETLDLLNKYEDYKVAAENLIFPNITFSDKLVFENEDVEFFHTPGHTEDSASCYDRIDKILLVGDSLVSPLPSINWYNLDVFIETLQSYKEIDFNKIILAHEIVLEDTNFIDETIEYIKRFKALDVDFTGFTDNHALMYRWGLVNIARNLKKDGEEEEAKKFFLKAKTDIENPLIKPKDESEYKQIIELIDEGIKTQ